MTYSVCLPNPFSMNSIQNRKQWKVLCWNVGGLNSESKWDSIRDKIVESKCDIVCLQQTKKEFIDTSFIKKICPPYLDAFVFLPSVGASGGIITIWKSSLFAGHLVFQNDFSISVDFTSKYNNEEWTFTNVYGPYTTERKRLFTDWLGSIQISDDADWLLVGDFNLIGSPEDRNKPGGSISEMFMFNEAISTLGLVDLPL